MVNSLQHNQQMFNNISNNRRRQRQPVQVLARNGHVRIVHLKMNYKKVLVKCVIYQKETIYEIYSP